MTRSIELHQLARSLRAEADQIVAAPVAGRSIGEIGAAWDRAKTLRKEAGIALRRARAAAKREGRVPR